MPELPEVETTKQSLKPILGKKVDKIEVFHTKLRWPVAANLSRLEGYTLKNVSRRAKYLILEFTAEDDYDNNNNIKKSTTPINSRHQSLALVIHLGMSGSLQQYPVGSKKRKHDHLIFHMSADSEANDTAVQLHYHDPRRFGSVLWYEDYADKLFNHLGVEPLEDNFTGEYLYKRIHKIDPNTKLTPAKNHHTDSEHKIRSAARPITRPIKAVIMDQTFVVGVGNIYATESLFLAGIHPNTPANVLSLAQLSTLTDHIKTILKRAIKQGGSTLRDFTVASGTTGYFQQTLNVYGKYKHPCPHCATIIDKVTITGRASTFCPLCQPLVTNNKS